MKNIEDRRNSAAERAVTSGTITSGMAERAPEKDAATITRKGDPFSYRKEGTGYVVVDVDLSRVAEDRKDRAKKAIGHKVSAEQFDRSGTPDTTEADIEARSSELSEEIKTEAHSPEMGMEMMEAASEVDSAILDGRDSRVLSKMLKQVLANANSKQAMKQGIEDFLRYLEEQKSPKVDKFDTPAGP